MNRCVLVVPMIVLAALAGCAMDASPGYGPPVAPASIVTLDPALEDALILYGTDTPAAEQGEGGPDGTLAPPVWAVPADQCLDVRALLARHDLIGPTADRLVWIARKESDCGAQRVHGTDYGLWQVSWPHWGAALCRQANICVSPWDLAHNDDIQVEAVSVILDIQGWTAWCWATPDQVMRQVGYECPWGIEEQG